MPLWILFSSGTTGLPKAITHSHGGILLEQLKLQRLNMDLKPGDVLFFYTTTGWMMWNFLVSSLVLGRQAAAVRREPRLPGAGRAVADGRRGEGDAVRRVARLRGHARQARRGAEGQVRPVRAEGVHAGRLAGLARGVRLVPTATSSATCGCTWAAAAPTCAAGFTGGSPTLPVYAGEHQHRNLGVAAYAFNDDGRDRRERGRRDGDHQADAVDAGEVLGRRRAA